MDAVEYLKEAIRICNTTNDCKECPFRNLKATFPCHSWVDSVDVANPEKAVAIVEKWSAEHPKKTRQSEFLKMFPNAQLDDDGMFNFSLKPCDIDPEYADKVCDQYSDCQDCQREYWSEEVEYEFKK